MARIRNDIITHKLLDYCADANEYEIVATRLESKTHTEAAKKLGINRHKVGDVIRDVYLRMNSDLSTEAVNCETEQSEASKKYLSEYIVKGESILYDEDGNEKLRWVKTDSNKAMQLKAYEDAVTSLLEKLESKELKLDFDLKLNNPKNILSSEEAVVYPLGDMHIGMFSWDKETGDDYDLEIAHKTIITAYKKLCASAPDTETAFLINLGDFFHIDNYNGMTAKSNNRLDFDTRWPKVLETGLQIMVELVYMLLQKHTKIIIRNAKGNHDTHSTIFLNAYLKAWFKNDERVIVEQSPATFWFHKWGKNLIGVTHGDTVKMDTLPEIMAADAEKYWSDTKYRYWYIGHVHHMQKKEFRSCIVESFNTIAAKDAWHYESGYRSQRLIKYKVLHKEYGEIQEGSVNVKMIEKDNND